MTSSLKTLALSSLILLTACNQTPTKAPTSPDELASQKGYTLGEPVDKIMNYKINGWNYINSQALIINSGPSRNFLITLKRRCYDLSGQEVIASTSTGSAMRAGFDAIIVKRDSMGNLLDAADTDKCYIDKIYKLEKTTSNASQTPQIKSFG